MEIPITLRRPGLAGCLFLAAAPSTYANEHPSARTLDTVQVTADADLPGSYTVKRASAATKLSMSLRQTPQSMTVVTRQRLDDMGLFALSDVMGQVTGVAVSSTDSERINYVSRGYNINNFQVDGMLNTFGGYIKTNTDSVIYDRIEVVRGATGLTTGAGDPSGTINFIRKRPTDSLQMGANLTYGRWNNRRLEADLGGPIAWDGRIRARVVAAKQETDSFRDIYKLDKDVLYGIVQARVTDTTLVEAGYEYQSPRNTGVTWGVLPYWGADGQPANLPRSTNLSARWSSWPIVEKSYFLRAEQNLARDWTLKAAYTNSKRNTEGQVWYGASGYPRPDGTGIRAFIGSFSENGEMEVIDLNIGGPFQLLGKEHELVFGFGQSLRKGRVPATLEAEYPASYENVPDWRRWSGDVAPLGLKKLGYLESQDELRQRAAYLATRLQLAEPLTAVLGARYGSWETRTWSYDHDNNGRLTGAKRGGYKPDDTLTPYAGLVYDISRHFSGYASYTDIFQPQNYRDKSNNYLEPVVGSMVEIGAKAEFFDGLLNASAAVFEGRKDNVAELDDTVPPNSLPGGESAYRSTGKGNKVKGWEVEAQGSVGQNWSLASGFTHTVIRNANGLRQNTTVPVDLFRLNATWRPGGPEGRFWIGGGATWQSGISRRWRNSKFGAIEQGDFYLANIFGGYRISDSLSAQINVSNLFDKKYYNNVGFYEGVYWGEPRNVTVTLRWKLQ